MSNINYTTIDRILAKLSRELPEEDFQEDDIIEWIGEALDFLSVHRVLESAVYIGTVKDFQMDVPEHLQNVIQIAKYIGDKENASCNCNGVDKSEKEYDCYKDTNPIYELQDEICSSDYLTPKGFTACEEPCLRPYFNMNIDYKIWELSPTYKNKFTPVRLADHTFFNSIVCHVDDYDSLYHSCVDEYTIVGSVDKKFRFSFRDGNVAISYIRSRIDMETGLPYIPDTSSHISAITYYVKWKIAEIKLWNGDRNFGNLSQDMERKWLKYVGQANNKMKMPGGIDEYQNLLEGSRYLLPRNHYYGFFGNLNKQPNKLF